MKPYTWRTAIIKSDLKPTTRHVLLTLSCHINDAGESAYPSTKLLADETGLSERAVITHLHEAEEAGWLEIRKHGYGGQRWARNEYYPSIPDGFFKEEGTEADSAPLNKKALNVATEGTERPSKGTERSDIKALKDVQSNSPEELSIEQSKEKKRGQAASSYSPLAHLVELGVAEQIAADWLQVRKLKKSASTKTAIEGVLERIAQAGMTPDAGLRICCERGWAGFNREWLGNAPRASPQGYESEKDRSRREAADKLTGRSPNDQRNSTFVDIN
jgi:hypothetical protein